MDVLEKVTLKIKSKPISTNSAYFSRNRSFNEKARAWRANFLESLQNDYNQNQIAKIKRIFNPKKHMIRVVFHWYQPRDVLLTKEGTLSLRSMDVDNVLKIPTDCIFDRKYNSKWLELRKGREKKLYSITSLTNLDINDKFIFDTRSIKLPSDDNEFHCSVDIEVVSSW
jgi:hypothetical protein